MKKLLAILLLFFHVSVASDMKLIGQGTLKDESFARSYINIWLGEETSQPKLRSQLLVEN